MFQNASGFKKLFVISWSVMFLTVGIMIARSFSQPEMHNVVPVQMARKAAGNEISAIKLLEEWHGAVVSSEEPVIFFDLNHSPSAYMFKVIKDGRYAGYIAVSASFDFYPIREYSSALFPTENLEKCKQKASSLIGALSREYELIYLGGTIYLTKFSSLSRNNIVLSLSPCGMVIPEENLKKAQLCLEKRANEIKQKAKLTWEKITQ